MGSICSGLEEEKKKSNALVKPITNMNGDSDSDSDDDGDDDGDDLALSPSDDDSKVIRLDHPLEIAQQHYLMFDPHVRVDTSSKDYRAFCLLIHREQGAVLLHCTRKKKKPSHYQLSGGHVDDDEFKTVNKNSVTQQQLYCAARIGCAREVFEETGIDLRQRLEELRPMVLYNPATEDFKKEILINEFKSRLFYVCEVKDKDFPRARRSGWRSLSVAKHSSCPLTLQLSIEHSGFRFFKDVSEISKRLKHHSGGKVQTAVDMAYNLK